MICTDGLLDGLPAGCEPGSATSLASLSRWASTLLPTVVFWPSAIQPAGDAFETTALNVTKLRAIVPGCVVQGAEHPGENGDGLSLV